MPAHDQAATSRKKFVILAGPAGVGKRTLGDAFLQHSGISCGVVALLRTSLDDADQPQTPWYESVQSGQIHTLAHERAAVGTVGEHLVAFDFDLLDRALQSHTVALAILPFALIEAVRSHLRCRQAIQTGALRVRRVLLSPLRQDELRRCRVLYPVQDVLAARQIHRRLVEGGIIDASVYSQMMRHAKEGASELEQLARLCDATIVLHDGPSNPNWMESPPVGAAGRALEELKKVIAGT